jgi:small-conductance mechanosensitive channel
MTLIHDGFADIIALLESWNVMKQAVSSFALIVAFFLFRSMLILTIRRWNAPSGEDKRRWIIQVKNMSFIILAAGLFGIWATELRAFALSLVAVAAALAISFKEIIQCVLGGFYITSAKPFELGDRIEVNGCRGEVIDHNFLSTTLLEIGPQREINQLSGRQVVLPNSVFLLYPLQNQSLQQDYVLQTLRLLIYEGEDWRQTEKLLLEAANRECQPFLEPALHAMSRMAQREGLDLPRVEPRVTVQYDDHGRLHVTLRFPAPAGNVSRVEQAIVRSIVGARAVKNVPLHV